MKSSFEVIDHTSPFGIKKIDFDRFLFSGGETQVRLLDTNIKRPAIEATILDAEGIMTLLLLSNAVDKCRPISKKLILNYLPYARQDRVCYEGEAFSLEVMANLINSMEFNEVKLFDPHSDVAANLIDNCKVETIDFVINKVIEKSIDAVVCPDRGAIQRTEEFSKNTGLPVVHAVKLRDPKNGNIVATLVEEDVNRKVLLIVDDICDGGRTFIELAKVLYKKGAREVHLQVTHGLFSKTKGPIYQSGITSINSYFDYSEKVNDLT